MDLVERWEQGIPHHPIAEAIYKLLADSDRLNNHSFDWQSGGDGDNGEVLMIALSEWIDRHPEKLQPLRDLLNNE